MTDACPICGQTWTVSPGADPMSCDDRWHRDRYLDDVAEADSRDCSDADASATQENAESGEA